MIMIAIYF